MNVEGMHCFALFDYVAICGLSWKNYPTSDFLQIWMATIFKDFDGYCWLTNLT